MGKPHDDWHFTVKLKTNRQISEAFRAAVVLPKNLAAQGQIELGTITEDTVRDCVVLFIGADLDILHGAGVFDRINSACGTAIGGYEEVLVHPNLLLMVAAALESGNFQITGTLIQRFVDDLTRMCVQGQEMQLPLYFVL